MTDDGFHWTPEEYVSIAMRIRHGEHNGYEIDVISQEGSHHYSPVCLAVLRRMIDELAEAEQRHESIDEVLYAGRPNSMPCVSAEATNILNREPRRDAYRSSISGWLLML